MNPARLAPLDDKPGTAKSGDRFDLIKGVSAKPVKHSAGAEQADLGHAHQLEAAVIRPGAGRDAGVVAILIGIHDREGEGLQAGGAAGVVDDDTLGLVRKKRRNTDPKIAGEAAVCQPAESHGDVGLEAEAHSVEEGETIDHTGVDRLWPTVQQCLESTVSRSRYAKMPAEAVAGAAGNQAKNRRRIDQSGGHFIHGAVATDRHDQFASVVDGMPGKFSGMTRPLGSHDRAVEAVAADEVHSPVPQVRIFPIGAGKGIEDEPDFQGGKEAKSETVPTRSGKSSFATNARTGCNGGMPPTVHVLTGCTAVGKTELALRWAEANGAEIVSCDSLLFYRGMDIGTAKPSLAEQARVSHHLIDIREVTGRMDVTEYVTLARAAVTGILSRRHKVLVTGGSGFYLQAFFAPVADDIQVPAGLRAGLRQRMETDGLDALVGELRRLNPSGLERLDLNNPRRVLRALERCLASGRTLAELKKEFAAQPGPFADCQVRLCELVREREELDQRITQRVAAMLAAGLVEEVRGLLGRGLRENPSAAKAIGYRESIDFIEQRLPNGELAETIAKNTRALVKKQRTWFKTQLPAHRQLPAHGARTENLFP